MEFWCRPEELWGLLLKKLRGLEELFGGGRKCVPVVGERGCGEVEIGARLRGWRQFRSRGFGRRGQTPAKQIRGLRSQTC